MKLQATKTVIVLEYPEVGILGTAGENESNASNELKVNFTS